MAKKAFRGNKIPMNNDLIDNRDTMSQISNCTHATA